MELFFTLPQLYVVVIVSLLMSIAVIFLKNKILRTVFIFVSLACFVYFVLFGILYGLGFDALVIIAAIYCCVFALGYVLEKGEEKA